MAQTFNKTSSQKQPTPQQLQSLLALFNAGQLVDTVRAATPLAKQFPNTFILFHVLALAYDGLGEFEPARQSYLHALRLQPNTPDLLFNLGIVCTKLQLLEDAVKAYEKAIQLQPGFFEAYGNLGTVFQQQGLLDKAIQAYQQGLNINPQDARGYFNLGTALRDNGDLSTAVEAYEKATSLFPNYVDAFNNLGETLRDQGDMQAAVNAYQKALSLHPQHAKAHYNMAEFLYLAKRYPEAIPHFEASQLDDWQARVLYCLYQAKDFDTFKTQLDALVKSGQHNSPFISTLANHYAINFNVENPYPFCSNPLDFVYQKSVPELIVPNSTLLKDLLDDINNTAIAARKQGMLHYGTQSAGNLFKRPEASFRALAKLIRNAFVDYKAHFQSADCALIKAFPSQLEFTSSWYVKMQKGGHLAPHIHEIGWLSGAVYLKMPSNTNAPDEGAFEYGMHGDNYPILPPRNFADFPLNRLMPKVGDIVLFPSSLFHRTIPFNSDEERICIAFDLKPD
jgi:uncharacterized protein (TIGR02466 family)